MVVKSVVIIHEPAPLSHTQWQTIVSDVPGKMALSQLDSHVQNKDARVIHWGCEIIYGIADDQGGPIRIGLLD
jgi:hypothetical protein